MEARPHLIRATELDPQNAPAWNNLGNHYGHMGPVNKAFECYEMAITLNPEAAVYYHNFGTTVYLYRKDAREHYDIQEEEVFDKALALYGVAQKKNPKTLIWPRISPKPTTGSAPGRFPQRWPDPKPHWLLGITLFPLPPVILRSRSSFASGQSSFGDGTNRSSF